MNYFSLLLSTLALFFIGVNSHAQMAIDMTPANDGMTFSTCNGFLIDSGGQGGTGYGNNESIVITICPDTPGEIISIVFNLFALDPTNTGTQQNPNMDFMAVYDGTSTAANSLGVYTGNQLQGVVIEATALNASGCITLEFYSNTVGTGMFTASVSCETPCNNPQAGGVIVGGITQDSIRVCVGDQVNFQEAGSFAQPGFTLVDYNWDFMDGTTANGQSVSHSYSVPGLYRVQLFVTDDNGCSNPNLIDLEVLVATIPDFTGFPSDTSICLGESMSFGAAPDTYEVLWNGFPGSQSVDDGCLPDTLLGVSQDIQLLQTGFSAGTTINSVNDIQSICLDLEHSFMGDLVIMIECPNAQTAILHQQGGGGTQIGIPVPTDDVDCSNPATMGTPFTYCFTPNATETWVDWVNNNPGVNTIPAGDYASIDPLTNLVGCPTNGVWTLTVIDNWAADDGTLFSFALNLDPSYYPPITTFTPDIGAASDSSYWLNPALYQTYLSPDADTLEVLPTAPGAYTYEYFVVNDFGCTHDTSVVLTVNPNPAVFAGNDTTLCDGNLMQLDGEIIGLVSSCDYQLTLDDSFGDGWNGNSITVTINGTPTTYDLLNGSTQTFNLQIPVGASVTVTFNATGTFLNECSYTVIDSDGNTIISQGPMSGTVTDNFTSNCVPDYVYEWTPANVVSDPTILDPQLMASGQQTLVLATYPLGHPLCMTSDTIVINVSAVPNPGVDSTLQVCSSGAPVDLFPYLGPGASPNGSWLDPNGATVNMPYDPQTMPIGDYVYFVDSNGCTAQAVITITEIITDITSIVPTSVSCFGLSDGSAVVSGNNVDGYSLDGGAPVVSGSPFTISGLSAGTYNVQVYSNLGCTADQDFTVDEPDTLTLSAAVVDASCFGVCDGEVQLTAVGGTTPYTFAWNGGVTGNQNGQASGICAGNYDADVTDVNGCAALVQYTITQPDDVTPVVSGDTLNGCFPHKVDFVNLTASQNIATTEVDFGDGSVEIFNGTDPFSHTYQAPGLYTVTVTLTTLDGCVYDVVYADLVEAYNYPTANFFVNPNNVSMMEPIVNLLDQSSYDVVSWLWTITTGSPATASTQNVSNVTYPVDSPGEYPVTLYVENIHGCSDSIVKNVSIVNDVLLFAPNTFTPDDDEFNQHWEFHISGIDIYDFDLQIFNRWGELIWESHDPNVFWDGTYNGKVVQEGSYSWTMSCKDLLDDNKYTFNGHVSVIR